MATSGTYERGFVKDCRRYHHLLDATTGWPARGLASVTVVGGTAFVAGQFATAAFLLGPEAGLELLEGADGIESALIAESGELVATRRMAGFSDLPGGVYRAYPFA